MPNMNDWSLVRSFLAVLRGGSLSAAARTTGLTQPTIGRHIDQFEDALGKGLFTRSPGGLIPTAAAVALQPHAEAMEGAMAALVRASESGGDKSAPRGTVRITSSEIMGSLVLPEILAEILAEIRFKFPEITFECAINNRSDDLLRRDADIAVRMVRPIQEGLVARKIGEVQLRLYGHRRYIDRFGNPTSIEKLMKGHVIGFDRDEFSARSVAAGTLPISRDLFSYRCDADTAQVAAIQAGLGIGVMQVTLARRNPDLVQVLGEQVKLKLDVWIAVHEGQRDQPAIRAVFDGLAQGLTAFLAE